MQSKARIECERAVGLPRGGNREFAPQRRVVDVSDRRDSGEAVECSAQNHEHEARRDARIRGPRGGEQELWRSERGGAGRRRKSEEVATAHAVMSPASATHEFRAGE